METIVRIPDHVVLMTEDMSLDHAVRIPCGRPQVEWEDVRISFNLHDNALAVAVTADTSALSVVRLRWNLPIPMGTRFVGDTWERAYGDLEWRGMNAIRPMPWYFLANLNHETAAYGVRVRPNALCFWQADESGITLWMDIRNGGRGVLLGGRTLNACEVVSEIYNDISSFEAAQRFCRVMCTDPILPKEPVYGSNNWYYAYGVSSHEEILADTQYICNLTKNCQNRPFMVVDAGWQAAVLSSKDSCCGGPWDRGNEKFPDMPGLARSIREAGCKPGIWVRVLRTEDDALPESWRLEKNHRSLDPSIPEVLDYVRGVVRTMSDWGYQLIKHDFSTYDIFERWGFAMNPYMGTSGWSFADRSRTTAEIVIELYRTILEGANGAYILGCNCIGHLGAGLMHMQRTGDDTSGQRWERTRKMGPNTLAFRLPQHRAFFDVDADCVGVLGTIPWEKNRQWAGLLAKSATPLFVSAKPGVLTEEEMAELAAAMEIASRQDGFAEPLDWMETNCPSHWRFNDGEVHFSWYEESGLLGFDFVS